MRTLLTGMFLILMLKSPVWADIEQDKAGCVGMNRRVDACTRLLKTGKFDRNYTAIIYYSRGLAHDRTQRYRHAIADYSQAIRLNPRHVYAYHNRGVANYRLRQYRKAIADYSKAIRLSRLNIFSYDGRWAYNGRGLANQALGNRRRAIADYRVAFRLGVTEAAAQLRKLGADKPPRGNPLLAHKNWRAKIFRGRFGGRGVVISATLRVRTAGYTAFLMIVRHPTSNLRIPVYELAFRRAEGPVSQVISTVKLEHMIPLGSNPPNTVLISYRGRLLARVRVRTINLPGTSPGGMPRR